MKRLLFILILFPSLSWGQETMVARMNPYVLGAGTVAAAAMTPFIETFDGGSACSFTGDSVCDNTTWAAFGTTATVTISSSATVPDTSNYVNCTDNNAVGYTGIASAITAGASRYGFLKVRYNTEDTTDGDKRILAGFKDASDNVVCAAGVENSGGTNYWTVYTGGSYGIAGAVELATMTTYWIWVEYVANTSCTVFAATSTAKPSATATVSSSVSTANAAKVFVQTLNEVGSHDLGQPAKYDRIKVKDSAWGNDGG